MKIRFYALLTICFASVAACPEDLTLAKDGATDYQIVNNAMTAKDAWNAKFLAWYLKELTGAGFPVVPELMKDRSKPCIYVGAALLPGSLENRSSAISKKAAALRAGMKESEWRVKNSGRDILLYGNGFDADFHAIMDFIATELGQRWYLRTAPPAIKRRQCVTLKPFGRKKSFAFALRELPQRNFTDYFRGATNAAEAGMTHRCVTPYIERYPMTFAMPAGLMDPAIQPEQRHGSCTHNIFMFLPPFEKYPGFEWLPKDNYFKSNPEYFSMNEMGRRVPDNQICLSSKELRKELLKNLETYFKVQGTDEMSVGFSYMDRPHKACCCPQCEASAKKYGAPGAPMFEFVMEAGEYLRKNHPQTILRCILYFENLTLRPPEFSKKFPDNVRLRFCPIENYINYPWNHPHNMKNNQLLEKWSKLTDRGMEAWLYSTSYFQMAFLPFSNTETFADTIKFLHKTGVRGVFYEFAPFNSGFGEKYMNFAELDIYLFYRLMKEPALNVKAAIREFTDAVYGKAAPLVRMYHRELQDSCGVKHPCGFRWRNNFEYFRGAFSYLTPERLRKWSGMFDEMDRLEPASAHIANLRRALDCAVYGRWAEFAKKYPDYFKDPGPVRARIGLPNGSLTRYAKAYLKESEERLALAKAEKPEDGWKYLKTMDAKFKFLMDQAARYRKEGEDEKALKSIETVLSLDLSIPQKSQAKYICGFLLNRIGELEKACAVYEETLKNDKHSKTMTFEICDVYINILTSLKKYEKMREVVDMLKQTGVYPGRMKIILDKVNRLDAALKK